MSQQPKKRNVWLWGCVIILLIGICIVLLTAGGGAAYVYLKPTPTSTVTNTPTNTPTSTLDYTATQQAQINATLTAQAPFTQTAVIKTATYQAYLDSIATRNAGKTATVQAFQLLLDQLFEDLGNRQYPDLSFLDTPIFGPRSGSLDHIEDGFIETFSAGVNVSDFAASAVFSVPYSLSQGSWDIGYLFRYNRTPRKYFNLVIGSNGTWSLKIYSNSTYFPLDSGSANVNTTVGEENEVLLIASESEGWVFLNGNFLTKLDLDDSRGAGNIMAGTGFWSGDEINGETTRFTEFTVWEIP